MRWWMFGLIGGCVLLVATSVKFIRTLIAGATGEANPAEGVLFAVSLFGLGFVCGLIVWAGRGWYRRIGLVGDALVGVAVMVVFFLACMLAFSPEALGEKFLSSGLPMFGLAVLAGAIAGAWTGRDVRKRMASRQPPPPNLNRFVLAQHLDYATALGELHRGKKVSHWMWFIFPQFAGLGSSSMSQTYAIKSLAEAEAYLAHPVLGPRLIECCEAALAVERKSAFDIFGSPDDMKLRSCVTLFAAVSPGGVFNKVLDKFYDGEPDRRTLELIGRVR